MIYEEEGKQEKRISAAYRKSAEVHILRALEYHQQGNYALADQDLEQTKLSLEILIKLSSPRMVAPQPRKRKKSRSSMDLPPSAKQIMVDEERKEAEVHILRGMGYQEQGKYVSAVQEVNENKLCLKMLMELLSLPPVNQNKRISRSPWI